MKPGDCFLILAEEPKRHLWVVISDPAINEAEVILVSFTTLRPKSDPACVVEPGEHPFMAERTCVAYRYGRCLPLSRLEALERTNGIRMKEPLSADLLERVLAGARDSDFTILSHRRVLVEQGLIDPGE
jgi:hypothetical protein